MLSSLFFGRSFINSLLLNAAVIKTSAKIRERLVNSMQKMCIYLMVEDCRLTHGMSEYIWVSC